MDVDREGMRLLPHFQLLEVLHGRQPTRPTFDVRTRFVAIRVVTPPLHPDPCEPTAVGPSVDLLWQLTAIG